MPTSVLLSVKPKFAEAILTGVKKFEFRRSLFRDPEVRTIVLYASSPVQRVVGEFSIGGIFDMDLDSLWCHTERNAGIEREYFDEYFSGRDSGFAVEVQQARRYPQPLDLLLDFGIQHPPQSFRYLPEASPADATTVDE